MFGLELSNISKDKWQQGNPKNYKEHSITCSVKHQIKDIGAQQFFLKEGPLAILPYNKNKFSVVWSIEDRYFIKNKKNISKLFKN